nr:glycosyltransferase [uncultured Chryseobacterium sp.]
MMSDIDLNPLVSICIPTFNGEKYLLEALDSVSSQTYKNIEVIISDDHSKDDTIKICKLFKDQAPFPVHIYQHTPGGIGSNWNHSIEKTNGEYIKLLFQDDILENNCIEVMIRNLLKHNLQIVVCKRSIVNEDSEPLNAGNWFNKYSDLQKLANIDVNPFYVLSKKDLKKLNFEIYSRENIIGEPCVSLFTKSLFKKVGKFDSNLKQALDYEYWLRVLAKFDIGIIEEKLVRFRFHKDQTTNINSENKVSEGFAIDKILYGKLLFYIDRKYSKYYIKNKYPLILKILSLRYKIFP